MILKKYRLNFLFLSCYFVVSGVTHAADSYWFRHDGSLQFLNKEQKQRAAIDIEIAEADQATSQGLMYRKELKPLHGMLFCFESEAPRYFYMKNTHLSLDIIFVKSDKRIIKIYPKTTPLSLTTLPSGQPAQYVIEVNAGFCQKYGVKVGDRITFTRN